jgi:hypothetical protein
MRLARKQAGDDKADAAACRICELCDWRVVIGISSPNLVRHQGLHDQGEYEQALNETTN